MYSNPNNCMTHFDWSSWTDIQVFTSFGENYIRDWRHSKVSFLQNYLFANAKISFPENEKLNAMRRLFFQSLLNLLTDQIT